MTITTIGLDIAKHVFQVHAADEDGRVLFQRRLRRNEVLRFFEKLAPCLVGIEACGSAHHWARSIASLGHDVRLMPPQYVRPYVKRNKNDAADAEAICEAVGRPSMRFVPVKSEDQQALLMLHRARRLLVTQRTMVANAIRSHLAEFGIVVAAGMQNLPKLVALLDDPREQRIPDLARQAIGVLAAQLGDLQERIAALEARIVEEHKANELSRRLATIPGIGPITATALVATIADPGHFRSARQFAAWLGLVPRQHSTGGKERLGRISKRGDAYLRRMLTTGAHAVLRWGRARRARASAWLTGLLDRRPVNVVAIALANKIARIAWAIMKKGTTYRAGHA